MLFRQWLVAGLATGVLATATWAVVGPDSIWQNNVVDKVRVAKANGGLTAWDKVPLGNRHPWILVHGLHQDNQTVDGMSPDNARQLFQLPMTNFQAIYRDDFNLELLADVKPFLFTYNAERDDDEIASDLNALIEGNPELTGAKVKLVFLAHSKGGCVTDNYVVNFGNRKFLRGVTLGSPLVGTMAASQDEMTKASKQLYPVLGKKLMSVIEKGINFGSLGVQWLRWHCEGLMRLHQVRPLDSRWYLYAGEVTPASTGFIARNIQLALLADSVFIGKLGNEGDFYLPLCAGFIKQAGGGISDGLVPVSSAHAVGFAQGANLRLEKNCDHYKLLQGRQGDLALHRQILYDLLTFVPGQAQDNFGFNMWLPAVPLVDLPALSESNLKDARVVWVDSRGQLQVADKGGINVRQISLSGQFNWPNWDGLDIVVARAQNGSSDIVRIKPDGKMFKLTTDGASILPSVMNGQVVCVSTGQLILRDKSGASAVILVDKLNLVSPPVIFADKIYFAHKKSGTTNLYWISIAQRGAKLSDAKQVMADIVRPIRVGDFLLGISQSGETKAILGGWMGFTEISLPSTIKASQKFVPTQTEVDIDDITGELYLVADGRVRYLDYQVLASYAPDWANELTSATLEKRTATLAVPSLDELAPSLGEGSQIDVK